MTNSQYFLIEILNKAQYDHGMTLKAIARKSYLSEKTLQRIRKNQKISPKSVFRMLCLYYSIGKKKNK
ncbi:MAG: hypothetical protein VX112_02840 [Pseudomonadota bacterium]|nr:hypothetical protein [Pseudomonadota bacterium]